MEKAIRLAQEGQYSTRPNPCVGAIVVQDGHIVGEGYHVQAGEPHAEVIAINIAQKKALGATLYVSLEPCTHHGKTPPCVDTIIAAGIQHVVVASQDPNPNVCGQGIARLKKAGINVSVGVLADNAIALNRGFFSTHKRHQPYVRLKMAMSIDAKTAMANGQSKWITGEKSRKDVQRLRARSGAIITGIGTVMHDNPRLTVRAHQWDCAPKHPISTPLRVVIDSALNIAPDAALFQAAGPIWIVCAQHPEDLNTRKVATLEAKGAKVFNLPNAHGQVDLAQLMQQLSAADKHDVLIEAGHRLAGSFIQAKLVDALWCYVAPKIMGSNTKELFDIPAISTLKEHVALSLQSITAMGDDIRIIYQIPHHHEKLIYYV